MYILNHDHKEIYVFFLLFRTRKITIVNFCLSKHLVPCEEKLTDQRGSLAYVSPDILSGECVFITQHTHSLANIHSVHIYQVA